MKYGSQENVDKLLQQFSLAENVYSHREKSSQNFVLVDQCCHGNVVEDCSKLKANIYTSKQYPGEVFVVFRGSDHLSNWTTHNMPIILDNAPKAYHQLADKTVEQVRKMHPDSKLNFIGHSAGGYMALYSGKKYNGGVLAIDPPTTSLLISQLNDSSMKKKLKNFTVINANSVVTSEKYYDLSDKLTLIKLKNDTKGPLDFISNHRMHNIERMLKRHLMIEHYDVGSKEIFDVDSIEEIANSYLFGKDKQRFREIYDSLSLENKEKLGKEFVNQMMLEQSRINHAKKYDEYKKQLEAEKVLFNTIGTFASNHITNSKLKTILLDVSESGGLLVEMREHLLTFDIELPSVFKTAFAFLAAASGPVSIALSVASTILKIRDFIKRKRKVKGYNHSSTDLQQLQRFENRLINIESLIRQLYEKMSSCFEQVLTNQEHIQLLLAAGFKGIENILDKNFTQIVDKLFDMGVLQQKKHRELLLQDFRKVLYLDSQVARSLNSHDTSIPLSAYCRDKLTKLLDKIEFWVCVESGSKGLTGVTEYSVINERQIIEMLGPRRITKQQELFFEYSAIDAFDCIGYLGQYASEFDGGQLNFDPNKLFNFRVWYRAARIYLSYADKVNDLDIEIIQNYQACLSVILEQCDNFTGFINYIRHKVIVEQVDDNPIVADDSNKEILAKNINKSHPGELLRHLQSQYAVTIDKINKLLSSVARAVNYAPLASNPDYQTVIKTFGNKDNYNMGTVLKSNSDDRVELEKLLLQLKSWQYLIRTYLHLIGYGEIAKKLFLEKGVFEDEILAIDLNLFSTQTKSDLPLKIFNDNNLGHYSTLRTETLYLNGNPVVYALIRSSTQIELYRQDLEFGDGSWEKMANGPKWSDADKYNDRSVFITINMCVVSIAKQPFLYLWCRNHSGIELHRYDPLKNIWLRCKDGPKWSSAHRYDQPEHYYKMKLLPISIDNKMTLLATVRGKHAIEIFKYDVETDEWCDLTCCNGPKWSDADNLSYKKFEYYWTFNAVVMTVENKPQLFVVMRIAAGVEIFMFDVGQQCWQEKKSFPSWIDTLEYNDHSVAHTFNVTVVNNKLCATIRNHFMLELWIYNPESDSWQNRNAGPAWSRNKLYNQTQHYWTIRTVSFIHAGNSYLVKMIRNKNHYEIHLHHVEANTWYFLKQSPEWPNSQNYHQDHINLTIRANVVSYKSGVKLLLFIRNKNNLDLYCCQLVPEMPERSLELESILYHDYINPCTSSEVEQLVQHVKTRAEQLQASLSFNVENIEKQSHSNEEQYQPTSPTPLINSTMMSIGLTKKSTQSQLRTAVVNHNIPMLNQIIKKINILDFWIRDKKGRTIFDLAASTSEILSTNSVYQLLYAELCNEKCQHEKSSVEMQSKSLSAVTKLNSHSMFASDSPVSSQSQIIMGNSDIEKTLLIECRRIEKQRQLSCIEEQLTTSRMISRGIENGKIMFVQDRIKQLETKVLKLEKLVNPLQLSEEKRIFLEQKNNESLLYFYRVLHNVLEEYFISAKLLNAGYIQRANYTLGDKAVEGIEAGALLMPLFGSFVGMAASRLMNLESAAVKKIKHCFKYAGEFIHFVFFVNVLTDVAEVVEHKLSHEFPIAALFFSENARIANVKHVSLTSNELKQTAEHLAYQITIRYQSQIRQLKSITDIHSAATCAKERILEILRCNEIKCKREQVVEHLLVHFGNAKLDGYSCPLLGSNTEVQTSSGVVWKRHYIFSKPTICLQNIEYKGVEIPSSTFSTEWSDSSVYGERIGTLTEVCKLQKQSDLINIREVWLNIFSDLDIKNNVLEVADTALKIKANIQETKSSMLEYSCWSKLLGKQSITTIVKNWENPIMSGATLPMTPQTEKTIEPNRLRENIQKYGLVVGCDVVTTNNCFFKSTFVQILKISQISYASIDIVRKAVVSHIETYLKFYHDMTYPNMNLEDFVNVLSDNKIVADYILMLAMSRILACNLVVFRDDKAEPIVFRQLNSVGTILLGYDAGGKYHSLQFNENVLKPPCDIENFIASVEVDKSNPLIQKISTTGVGFVT